MSDLVAPIVLALDEEDVRDGKQRDRNCCPVALRLAKTMPGATKISVGRLHAVWADADGVWWIADLPPNLREFISAFDGWDFDCPSPDLVTGSLSPVRVTADEQHL